MMRQTLSVPLMSSQHYSRCVGYAAMGGCVKFTVNSSNLDDSRIRLFNIRLSFHTLQLQLPSCGERTPLESL